MFLPCLNKVYDDDDDEIKIQRGGGGGGGGGGARFNKLTSVIHVSVQLLFMNFVITLSKKQWIHEA